MKGRHEEAEQVLVKLHRDPSDPTNSFAAKEYLIMKAQIEMEIETRMSYRQAFAKPSMRKRFIIGWLTMSGTQFSGLLVILSKKSLDSRRNACTFF
jgi:hypothetical protein